MDNHSNGTHEEQISLYGLFGDSSATLQGLNDHLSPSSLQQSPPSGSNKSIFASSIPVSPMKIANSRINHHGIMLSDLADRSPRSDRCGGSVLCSFVSIENLRCTRVGVKGQEFCDMHGKQELSKRFSSLSKPTILTSVASPISKTLKIVTMPSSPLISSPSRTFSFVSNLSSDVGKSTKIFKADVDSVSQGTSLHLPGRMVNFSKSVSSQYINGDCLGFPTRIPNSLLSQKVGQQITVPTKVHTSGLPKKSGDVTQHCIKAVPSSWNTALINNCSKSNSNIIPNAIDNARTSSSINRMNLNLSYSLASPQHKAVRLNMAKSITPSIGVTNGICQSPVPDFGHTQTNKSQQLPQKQIGSSKTKYLLCTAVTSQPAAHPKSQQTLQSFVVDEKTMKKLIEVLNSPNEASPQQQISLMNSLGITVVRPQENDCSLMKKRSHSMKKAGAISKTRPKVAKKFTVKQSDLDRRLAACNGTAHVYPNWTTSLNENSGIKTTSENHVQLATVSSPSIKSNERRTNVHMPSVSKLNVNNTSVHMASSHTCFVKPMNLINQTTAVVSTLKRKATQTSSDTVTKRDKTYNNDSVVYSNGAECFSDTDLKTYKISYKQNETFVSQGDRVTANHDIKKLDRPAFLTVSKGAPTALGRYAELFNEERLKECGLFEVGNYPSESDTDPGDVFHGMNTGKRKVFTKKTAKSRQKKKKNSDLHETCLKGLDKTEFHEKLKAAGTLMATLVFPGAKKRGSKHDEGIKQRILERRQPVGIYRTSDFFSHLADNDSWVLKETEYLHEACWASCAKQRKIEYSLKDRRLKRELKQQRKILQRDLHSADLLMEAWEENSSVTDRVLSSSSPRSLLKKSQSTNRKRCQLSDSNGLNCSAIALPFALYCKQHIWHCRSQCLYKLDKNMKPVADVNAEPFVKRTRKRTKLLPLIKRYKKKRKKKPLDVSDGFLVNDKSSVHSEGSVTHTETIMSASGLSAAGGQIEPASVQQNAIKVVEKEEMTDENQTADTSEEDLNLTGQEIMINAVFDKLPEDIHDFDLFTTDKGAEELEQALLLDANTQQFESFYMASSNDETPTSSSNKPGLLKVSSNCENSKQLVDRTKKNPSDQCVVLNVPTSSVNDPPLSVISVDGSQCVHYTFGSNCGLTSTYLATKKDVPNQCILATSSKDESYDSMELAEPVLSAEDLQDIEGVLESLQKDVDATKSPSSPAVDHYTTMLARQLSREVEGESFHKQLSSTSRNMISTAVPKTVSTTRSLCLPISSISTPISSNDLSDKPNPSFGEDLSKTRTVAEELRMAPKSLSSYSLESTMLNSPVVSWSSMLAKTISTAALTTNVKNSITEQTINSVGSQSLKEKSMLTGNKVDKSAAPQISFLKKSEHSSLGDQTSEKESVGLQTQLELNADTKKTSKKSPWKVNQIVSNGLPTQSPTQGGNILRVIVPHGTVVSGANTNAGSSQNMILIPVSTLVRPNLMLAPKQNVDLGTSVAAASHQYSMVVNQAVKTQLTNLQAGQQFFIVNGGAGLHQKNSSSQQRFTVMQKNKSITGCQRTLILNPVTSPTTSVKNGTSSEQKPLNQKNWKPPLCNIKPNVSIYLNGTGNNYMGGTVVTTSKMNKSGKVAQAMPKLANAPLTLTNTLNARLKHSVYRQKSTAMGKSHFSQVNLNGGMKTKTKKTIKARFDPITKKYVPANVSLTQETVVSNSPPISNLKLSKTILKEQFTQSTLSIQNKVEQINSVLSSLNSAKLSSGGGTEKHFVHSLTTNGLLDRGSVEKCRQTAKHCAPILSKSKNGMVVNSGLSVTSTHSLTNSTSKIPFKSPMPGPPIINTSLLLSGDKRTLPVVYNTVDSKTILNSPGNSSSSSGGSIVIGKIQENQTSRTELKPIIVNTAVISDTGDPCKQSEPVTPVSTGTVHWNQTTTAGPDVNPHITLPMFLNGTLPTGAWLSKVGTDGRVFATHKVCPNYQLSQRVILGNIGSLGGVLSTTINSNKKSVEATSSTIQTFTQSMVKVTTDHASDVAIRNDGGMSTSNTVLIQAVASSCVTNSVSCGALKLLVSPSSSVTNVTAVMGTTMSPKLSTLNTTKIGIVDNSEHPASSKSPNKHVVSSAQEKVSDASSSSYNHELKYYTSIPSRNGQWISDIVVNRAKQTPLISSSTLSEQIGIRQDNTSTVSNHDGAENLVDALNVPSRCLIKTEERIFPRKNVRKDNHDTLLFDPFMYDPTSVKSVSSSTL